MKAKYKKIRHANDYSDTEAHAVSIDGYFDLFS